MDFNGQYLGAYEMRLSYISDCLQRLDSRRAQTGALKKANAIIKHSRHSTVTTLILKSYNANRLQSQNATRWSSQLTAIESLTKLSMDMETSFIIATHRMRAAYMNVFSLPNFVILRLTALFAIGWSFPFTLRPKKLTGTNFHNYSSVEVGNL